MPSPDVRILPGFTPVTEQVQPRVGDVYQLAGGNVVTVIDPLGIKSPEQILVATVLLPRDEQGSPLIAQMDTITGDSIVAQAETPLSTPQIIWGAVAFIGTNMRRRAGWDADAVDEARGEFEQAMRRRVQEGLDQQRINDASGASKMLRTRRGIRE